MLTEKLEFANLIENVEGYLDGQADTISNLIEIALKNVVKRAIETGKKSSLTVTLDFTRLDDKRVSISGDLKTKLPEGSKEAKTFYFDKWCDLSLEEFDRENNVSLIKKVS
jgi:hypothetical protein